MSVNIMADDDRSIKFWEHKWLINDAFWHITKANPFLMTHVNHITKKHNPARILIPLCGKTVDMKWLYDQGHAVVGVDGVVEPIVQFFEEHGLTYNKIQKENYAVFSTEDERLKIYHYDLFSITPEICGKFDGVWDRGSLIAISANDRIKYASAIKQLLNEDFCYLLDTLDYDQSEYPGPPQTVPEGEIRRLYGDLCDMEILEKVDRKANPAEYVPEIWKAVSTIHEMIVKLTPKAN